MKENASKNKSKKKKEKEMLEKDHSKKECLLSPLSLSPHVHDALICTQNTVKKEEKKTRKIFIAFSFFLL